MVGVIFSDVAAEDAGLQGTLFQGLKFWLAQRVPQRSRFIADIKANGGDVFPLDKQADIRIVDHARKEVIPGTHSYTFIEKSIRNGSLEDLEDHIAGPPPGTVRSIGSIVQPAKASRNKFTQEDDLVLWQWVQNTPQKFGGTDGNEIYKQLEAQNPRHPWQSWRDRWIKHLKAKPRGHFMPDNAPLTPPSDHPPPQTDVEMLRSRRGVKPSFSDVDKTALLSQGEDILNVDPENKMAAWEAWAMNRDGDHTAQEWENLWEQSLRPIFLRTRDIKTSHTSTNSASPKLQAATFPKRTYTHATQIPDIDIINSHLSTTRSPPYQTKVPNGKPQSPSLSVQSPQQKSPRLDIPRSDSPEVGQAGDDEQQAEDENTLSTSMLEEPHTPPLHSKPRSHFRGSQSPKRKRDILDEDELPSSSPPGSPVSMPLAVKRQRLDEIRHQPLEIASTPENSPTRQTLHLASRMLQEDEVEIVDIQDDSLSVDNPSSGSESSPMGRQASPTLSSPTHLFSSTQVATTQAAFQDPTQSIDFDIPPPDEGWEEEDIPSDVEPEPDPNTQLVNFDRDYAVPETQPILPDTQALLNSMTQIPDLGVADPDGGWDAIDQMPSPPPMLAGRSPTPPLAASDSLRLAADVWAVVDDFIDSQKALGYRAEDIVTALKATTMVHDTAAEVLAYMKKTGKGRIPGNVAGVWTAQDDADLLGVDARGLMRVRKKHGDLVCDWRFNHLEHWRDR